MKNISMNKTTMEQDFAQLKGRELLSKRGVAQKTFDLGKGRRQAISYGEPVHFRNNEGWQEIDNRLVLDEKNNVYRTSANAYATELACKDSGKDIVTLRRDGVAFGIRYFGEDCGATAEILESKKQSHVNEQEARADLSEKLHSGVKYTELRPGMDVEIHIDGKGLKDNIILKTPEALDYAGVVLPEGFEYEQEENGGTCVSYRGEAYIDILRPCAFDAKGDEIEVRAVLDGRMLRYVVENADEAVFPITIDPCISYRNVEDAMVSAYINSGSPSSNYCTAYLRVGNNNNREFISLIRPTVLVGQKASDTILSAQLYLKTSTYSIPGNPSSQQTSDRYAGTYLLKNTWVENGVTWSGMTPAAETHISRDMQSYVGFIPEKTWCSFDISEAYKHWYNKDTNNASTNFGVALRTPNCGNNTFSEYESTRAPHSKPYMIVNYVSHAGRKGWWKYETMGTGRAGAVYADIYNGNLIAEHADTATAGNRMPVSVSHIYNSCLSDDNSAYCGLGWRLSLNQSLRRETILSQDYYIWQDGDGTEHYFEVTEDAPYSDSEGMQLKLAVNSNNIIITDKSDTVMTFPLISASERAYITSVADAQGNTMTLAYDANDAGKVVSATDGVGRVTTLSYNADGLLASITAPGCLVVSYTYSGNSTDGWLLSRVNYSDLSSNQYTEYSYDTYGGTQNTATLITLKNYDGIQTNIVYDTALDTTVISNYCEQTRKVVSLEQTNGTVRGAKKLIKYGHMNTTIKFVTDTDSDVNGKEIKYHFNNAGNVISSHDEMWHAVAAEYDSGIDNTPSATSNLMKSVVNRIPNTDFYSGWTQVKAVSSESIANDTNETCMSLPSARLQKKGAGEFKQRITAQLFESGTYTLSAFIKTSGLTVASGYKGAFLRVTANGNVYESRAAVSSTAGKGVGTFAEGWERLSVSFPFVYGTDTSVTVDLVCDASAGTLNWACPQLEAGSLANHFNMLSDGDFSLTSMSGGRLVPDKWDISGSDASTATVNGVITDRSVNGMPSEVSGNALKLSSKPNINHVYLTQEIRARGAMNDVFTLNAWCNAESVTSGLPGFEPYIAVQFCNANDSQWYSWHALKFSTERSGWHCLCAQIAAPYDFVRVKIGIFYMQNDNSAMFTHLSLTRELYGNVYTFDENGNPVSVKDRSNQQSAADYDSFNNLLSYVQPGSASTEKYLFTYGDTEAEQKRHLPRTVITPGSMKTSLTYDSYGNILTRTMQENDAAPFVRTETEYTSNGNYVAKQKDARGKEMINALDANGKVLSITDPTGQSIDYTYDSSNRVTKVETNYAQGGQSLTSKDEYTYENDRIKTVAHNTIDNNTIDVRYSFNYDSLGRKTSVTVSNGQSGATEQPLSTNVYSNDRKSRLEEVQYGNGGKVKYSYDEFDRVIGVTHDNDTDPKFTYEYDAKGRAAVVKDTTNGSTIRNNYDQTDRPTESEQRDENDDLEYRTLIEYDVKNRVKAFNEATETDSYKTEYSYDKDNRPTEIKYNGSNSTKVNYTYDKLNRVTNRTITNGTAYATQFGYVQGASAYGSNATTPLVQSITQGSGANALNFSYTYDSRGNITSETRNGITTTYEYDVLGQLTRVNDPNDPTAYNEGGLSNNGTTWIYVYDRGGNILSKAAYDYTTGAVGTVVRTWLYEYNDSNWKDKLTKFDGNTITYDAIGNPLNDGTWTYTWQAGRQLKSISKVEGGNTITMEFTYNHAGLRTKKVKKVNGVVAETTEYILNGKNVVELIHTDHTTGTTPAVNRMHFYYDAQGRVALVGFNGTLYSYVHNLQGDIIAILDNSGNLVVEYKYDAWGKPVSTTGTLTTTLGELNPFRYRGYVWDEEKELYYLRSRYYYAELCRFLTRDILLKNGKTYRYANNAPQVYIDADGNSSKLELNELFDDYYEYRDAEYIMEQLIRCNGNNPYLAFHEMAQIIAGTKLRDTGIYSSVELEESIFRETGKYFEGDISCLDSEGIKYLYEVKPLGVNGSKQLDKYIAAGNGRYKRGKTYIEDISTNVIEDYSLVVGSYLQDVAVIHYWWLQEEERVRNVDMYKYVKYSLCTVILSVLAIDDITGIGVMDEPLIPIVFAWAGA
ncbi:MAG: RHS repeat protein [Clostridia bacterium]|nr:RHS repeat protein [Clostridia bacterium]